MKKVNHPGYPILLCKLLYIFIAIAAVCITFVFVHIQIQPDFYSGWSANSIIRDSLISYTVFERWHQQPSSDYNLLSFNKIKIASLYINYLQLIGILWLTYQTVKEFSYIIKSVSVNETFLETNILSFEKMSKYLLIIFILSSVTVVNAEEANLHSYSLQFTPLILSLSAIVMAKIFKQGNQLLEENKLTI